jgi:hypothetical protein
MRFDFVLLLLGVIAGHSSAVITPRPLDHALFSEEICAFQRALFIGGFEDEPISKVQSEDAGFLAAERRNERS